MFKKKLLVTFSLGILLFSLPLANVKAEDEPDLPREQLNLSDVEITNLKSLGFSDSEIQNMGQEEYELNKNLTGEEISSNSRYFKVIETIEPITYKVKTTSDSNEVTDSIDIEISKEEFENQAYKSNISPYASTTKSTSYKRMTTSAVKLSTGKYRVKAQVEWTKMPKNRDKDVLGVGVNGAVWDPNGGEYGVQNWQTYNRVTNKRANGSATYKSSSNNWEYGADTYALTMNLKDDPTANNYVTNLMLTMYYSVEPLKSKPTIGLKAYGKYAHQENYYSVSPSIGFDGKAGFSITNGSDWNYQSVYTILDM